MKWRRLLKYFFKEEQGFNEEPKKNKAKLTKKWVDYAEERALINKKEAEDFKKKIALINSKLYTDNKFNFYKHDSSDWFPVYVDLENYKNSEIIYSTYFSHVYCELLYDFCKALQLSHLFTFTTIKPDNYNDIILVEKSVKIKNKDNNIRLSAYLQHIVKTFEDNNMDIFHPNSVHAIFDYDDISVIETVRNVLIEFLIKSSKGGVSEHLRIFINNTDEVLKSKSLVAEKKTVNSLKNKHPKWFPIGLGFATGDIQKQLKGNNSARKIVKELNLFGYQNYISCTGVKSAKDPKNIYRDIKKLTLVYNHCNENNIKMCSEFEDAYNKGLNDVGK